MGVMINMLGGNAETVAAHQGAVGKTIVSARLKDDSLWLDFADGTGIHFLDEGQSCCENRYMRTDDDLASYVGATFIEAELASAPAVTDEYGEHDVQFLNVKTSKGVLTMSSHNEHNGYYGGFAIVVRTHEVTS